MLLFKDDAAARKKVISEIEARLSFFTEHSISINGLKDDDYCWLPIEWEFEEAEGRFIPSRDNLLRIVATGIFEEYLTRTSDYDERLGLILHDLCDVLERKFWHPKKADKFQCYQFKRPQAE